MKNKSSTKKIILSIALVLIVLAVGWLLFVKNHNKSTTHLPTATVPQETKYNPASDSEKQQVQDSKTSPVSGSPSPSTPASKYVKISQAQYDTATKQAVIQTELYGTGWQQCTVTISQGNQSITKTADTLYQSQFSTCLGFSIGVNEFPAGGTWNVLLRATNSDGQTYNSDQKTINVIK